MASRQSTDVVAIIPARAGSKGVPDKNLAPVAGVPLIAHTILSALRAPAISRVVVSTDSPRIAQVAHAYGADVPFLRPDELATDDAPGRAVWKHAIHALMNSLGMRPALTLYLQPTSPLRTAEDIERALDMQAARQADWIISCKRARESATWTTAPEADGRLPAFASIDLAATQRQSMPDRVVPNGAIYLARTEVLLNDPRLYTEQTYAYLMPEERSLDVDTPWDLHLADLILSARRHEPALEEHHTSTASLPREERTPTAFEKVEQ